MWGSLSHSEPKLSGNAHPADSMLVSVQLSVLDGDTPRKASVRRVPVRSWQWPAKQAHLVVGGRFAWHARPGPAAQTFAPVR